MIELKTVSDGIHLGMIVGAIVGIILIIIFHHFGGEQ